MRQGTAAKGLQTDGRINMPFDRKYIKSLFSFQDFSRGMEYYANGMVENTDLTFFGDDVIFSCFVQGNHRYEADIYLTDIDGDTFADMQASGRRHAGM